MSLLYLQGERNKLLGMDQGHQQLQPGFTAQHSTAQHSTAQHSTAQHSTAQHSLTLMTSASASSLSAGGKPGGCTMSKSACRYPLGRFRDLRRTSAISKRRKLSRPGPPVSSNNSDHNRYHDGKFACDEDLFNVT